MNDEAGVDRPALAARAKEALSSLVDTGGPVKQRRTLAALASLQYAERDYPRARDTYHSYVRQFPDSPWSWIAALRYGQTLEQLGDLAGAVDAYRDAAATYRRNAVARTLGHANAARTLESMSSFDDALRERRQALQGWDVDFGLTYSLRMGYPGIPVDLIEPEVRRHELAARVTQLDESLRSGGGHLLERGRWLLEHAQPTEALGPLERVQRSSRESRIADESRLLIHRARLLRALRWASATPQPDVAAALAELGLITSDEYDVGVFAAKVARASILARQEFAVNGMASQAEEVMQAALGEWHSHQMPERKGSTTIDRDLADIRNIVLKPDGGGIYGRWSASRFERRRRSGPFLIVNPEVRVKFADGTESIHSVYEDIEASDQVLFLTTSQLSLLETVHNSFEGNVAQRQVSPVRALWNRFFPEANRMSGVVLESSPIIIDIEFLDGARSRAAARVAVGSQGCTVVLEQDRGTWKAVRLANMWIS